MKMQLLCDLGHSCCPLAPPSGSLFVSCPASASLRGLGAAGTALGGGFPCPKLACNSLPGSSAAILIASPRQVAGIVPDSTVVPQTLPWGGVRCAVTRRCSISTRMGLFSGLFLSLCVSTF